MHRAEDVVRITSKIYAATLDDDLWFPALKDIEVLLGANNVHLLIFDRETFLPVFGMLTRFPEANGEFISHYSAIDERLPRIRHAPDAMPINHQRYYRDGERKRSETYNDFLGKYDAQNQLITRMDGPAGDSIVTSVIRGRKCGAYDDYEIDAMRQLVPHIRRAMRIRHELWMATATCHALSAMLETSNIGVVFVDRDRRVVELNAAAHATIAANDGLKLVSRRLTAAGGDNVKLQAMVAEATRCATETNPATGNCVLIARPSMRPPYVVVATPIESTDVDFGLRRPAAAIFLRERGQRGVIATAVLGSFYDLTPTEAALVKALIDGRSVKQHAESSGRSENTVRWTLKNVQHKTGARSQADLVRTVLSDAPLAAAIDPDDF